MQKIKLFQIKLYCGCQFDEYTSWIYEVDHNNDGWVCTEYTTEPTRGVNSGGDEGAEVPPPHILDGMDGPPLNNLW